MKRFYAFFFLLCSTILLHAHAHIPPLYIIIHGTWASNSAWAKPGGNFFEALEHSLKHYHGTVTHFTWSGKIDSKSRIAAGKELARVIQNYPTSTPICIVGHSHGANVGIIASQELARINDHHIIEKFFALAPPVNTTEYMPAMDIIHFFYNFFSLQDYIQPVLGIFSRVYPEHPRIANLRIVLEDRQTSHSSLHDPIIAAWIPHIHEHLRSNNLGNFHKFSFGKPGVVCFFNHGEPYYKDDNMRSRLIDEDTQQQEQLLLAACRSKN